MTRTERTHIASHKNARTSRKAADTLTRKQWTRAVGIPGIETTLEDEVDRVRHEPALLAVSPRSSPRVVVSE